MISSYNPHTETFFKNLKLLKIQDILTLQTLHCYANSKGRSAVNDDDTAATTLAARRETH